MCGIAGVIGEKLKNKDRVIKEMNAAIIHRGPDEDGFHVDDFVGLGMRRLSIIDLSTGTQPIVSEDGNFMIFFNGEIYNYKELRDELIAEGSKFKTESDTEVILQMFISYGPRMLTKLRGMFAFCIYDIREGVLLIARDYFGIKPLYYLTSEDRVVGFSSEIKSFFAYPGFKPEINEEAVYNYLSFQYNPLDESFLKGVYKLPPAHYLEVNVRTGQKRITKYWQFRFGKDNNLNKKKTKVKILETMKDSVAHHMIADVPVGAFLSGGIDSSIIATLMQKIRGTQKIKTFTVGFSTLSEGKEAKETSSPLGTDHKEITVGEDEFFKALPKAVWHFDEPVADPSALGLYFLAREARQEVKVVLSGEGADEFFGGYNIYLEPFARKKIAWLPRFILKIIQALPFRGRNYATRALSRLEDWYIGNASIFSKSELKEMWKGEKFSSMSLTSFYGEVKNESDSTKMQHIDIHTWLVGDILAKADKMTMAHSLELRVPFLDIEVVKLAETLPDRFKWRGGVTKYLLRESFKKILPEATRKRKKLGFPTPVRDWFTSNRKDLYHLILGNSYIKNRMNTEYIRILISDHTSKRKDNSRKIYLLLLLAIWYNIFIEGKPVK